MDFNGKNPYYRTSLCGRYRISKSMVCGQRFYECWFIGDDGRGKAMIQSRISEWEAAVKICELHEAGRFGEKIRA